MEKVFDAFRKATQFLGQGKSFMVGKIEVKVWTLVAMGIFIALTVGHYLVFVR